MKEHTYKIEFKKLRKKLSEDMTKDPDDYENNYDAFLRFMAEITGQSKEWKAINAKSIAKMCWNLEGLIINNLCYKFDKKYRPISEVTMMDISLKVKTLDALRSIQIHVRHVARELLKETT